MSPDREFKRQTPRGRVVVFRKRRGTDRYEFRYADEPERAFAGSMTMRDIERMTREMPQGVMAL